MAGYTTKLSSLITLLKRGFLMMDLWSESAKSQYVCRSKLGVRAFQTSDFKRHLNASIYHFFIMLDVD